MRTCMSMTGDVLGQVTPSDQARLGLGSYWAEGLFANWILFSPGRLPSAREVGVLDRSFLGK
jgi:hypothetical protein